MVSVFAKGACCPSHFVLTASVWQFIFDLMERGSSWGKTSQHAPKGATDDSKKPHSHRTVAFDPLLHSWLHKQLDCCKQISRRIAATGVSSRRAHPSTLHTCTYTVQQNHAVRPYLTQPPTNIKKNQKTKKTKKKPNDIYFLYPLPGWHLVPSPDATALQQPLKLRALCVRPARATLASHRV